MGEKRERRRGRKRKTVSLDKYDTKIKCKFVCKIHVQIKNSKPRAVRKRRRQFPKCTQANGTKYGKQVNGLD